MPRRPRINRRKALRPEDVSIPQRLELITGHPFGPWRGAERSSAFSDEEERQEALEAVRPILERRRAEGRSVWALDQAEPA